MRAMNNTVTRREFLEAAGTTSATVAVASRHRGRATNRTALQDLAGRVVAPQDAVRQEARNLDFAKTAKEDYGIDAIEFVNQFFKDKAKDQKYLAELEKAGRRPGREDAADHDRRRGGARRQGRRQADQGRREPLQVGRCRQVPRLPFHSRQRTVHNDFEEAKKLAADGLRRLSEFAAKQGLNVIVENHGGLSSNGKWLSETIKSVGLKNCGTLPDFGNFRISRHPVAAIWMQKS